MKVSKFFSFLFASALALVIAPQAANAETAQLQLDTTMTLKTSDGKSVSSSQFVSSTNTSALD